MAKLSARERKALSVYSSYINSNRRSLYDCYKSFSNKKAEAWEYCENLMKEKNGRNLKVISSNVYTFTAGFEFEDEDKDMFMYITPSYDAYVEV